MWIRWCSKPRQLAVRYAAAVFAKGVRMTITRLLLLGAFVGAITWGGYRHFDPYSAKLPLDKTDLSAIQEHIDKLSPEDQAHVKDYVKRTGGAASDTVGEAISRQKAWIAEGARFNVAVDAEFAAYNMKYDALRKVLQIELSRANAPGPKPDTSRFPHTFRFKNTSPRTIEAFEAWVLMRPRRVSLNALGSPLWGRTGFAYPFRRGGIDLPAGYRPPVLIPFASVDVNSAPLIAGGLALETAPGSEWILETYPTYIRFTDGQELKVPEELAKQLPNTSEILRRLPEM